MNLTISIKEYEDFTYWRQGLLISRLQNVSPKTVYGFAIHRTLRTGNEKDITYLILELREDYMNNPVSSKNILGFDLMKYLQ